MPRMEGEHEEEEEGRGRELRVGGRGRGRGEGEEEEEGRGGCESGREGKEVEGRGGGGEEEERREQEQGREREERRRKGGSEGRRRQERRKNEKRREAELKLRRPVREGKQDVTAVSTAGGGTGCRARGPDHTKAPVQQAAVDTFLKIALNLFFSK